MKIKIHILLYFILSIFLLSGCGKDEPVNTYLSKTTFMFDTVVTFQLYDTTDEDIMNQAIALCAKYEGLFSRTIDTSEISQINASNGAPVTVSDETLELIKLGLYYSELSNGSFDITIAPLSNLWDFTSGANKLPPPEDIESAIANVDYHNIIVEGNTITLTTPTTMIDLGGIAKGYIADQLKIFFLDQGVEHGIINLGGNILTIGTHLDGTDFNVGIQEPFAASGTAIDSVSLDDQSLVSSGVYERYFKYNDVLYHHILDPQTGYPYETDLYGVTIISDKSVDGDALSTICMTLGLEQGMELIESLDHIDAIFITNELEVYHTAK